jgi:serine/threonine-protein phosphatase 2A regulatory subunit B''
MNNIPFPANTPDVHAPHSPPRSPAQIASQDFWVDEQFTLPPDAISAAVSPQNRHSGSQTPLVVSTPVSAAHSMNASSKVPPFFAPRKMAPDGQYLSSEETAAIDRLFASTGEFIKTASDLVPLLKDDLRVSRYFAEPLFRKLTERKSNSTAQLTKSDLVSFWRSNLVLGDGVCNFFSILKHEASITFLTRSDFREFLWTLLDHHPGLAFLRDSPEFQERYADTVICRIFYHYDYRQSGRIYLRDLRGSRGSIMKAWLDLDETEDINHIRDFFSYEHFYVLYCKFWDLDTDHDFLIDREDLNKYDGHAYSARALDRLFENVAMRFTSGIPGKMNYDDFVWFILSDEDKTSSMSVEFFFALIDLDGDGVIRDHEMRVFFDDQVRRLETIGQDAPAFADIMCQMSDLIRPDNEGQFKLENFLARRKQNAGAFFSILVSLNKFMGFEQRDPFQIKQDMLSNPELSDWDRFCAGEYVRLAMEAGSGGFMQNNQDS